jgi:hypothetical protein
MSSNIETGINTYVAHFQELIDICEGFGTYYNPQPRELRIASMKAQLADIRTAIDAVDTALPVSLNAEDVRRKKFAALPPLSARVQASAVIQELPEAIIVRIKEVVRKIQGRRAHLLKPEPEGSPDPEKHISVSQVSFNEQIEHFNQLIDLVASQPAYNPSEGELKVVFLKQLLAEMRDANDAAMAAKVPLTNVRQKRDLLLYAPKTGMMDTALRAKDYVKSVFGAASKQYKEVQHIKFHNK